MGMSPAPVNPLLLASLTAPLRRLTIGFAGESLSVFEGSLGSDSALAWALARDVWADIDIDTRSQANGGMVFGIGGSGTSSLLTVQLPQILSRLPDILFINCGNNDNPSNLTDVTTGVSRITTVIDTVLAAGTKLVIYRTIPPKGNSTLNAAQSQLYNEFNARMRAVVAARPNVKLIDSVPYLIDPASSLFYPLGNGATADSSLRAVGAVVVDGVHLSTIGGRLGASAWLDVLSILPRRVPRAKALSDVYDATNAPRGNFLGTSGYFRGTSGVVNGSANSNVAGESGSNKWTLTTSNGVTVTPTLITNADGTIDQNLALGGTATADTTVTFTITRYLGGTAFTAVGSPDFDAEMLFQNVGLTNITSVGLNSYINGSPNSTLVGMLLGSPLTGANIAPANTWPAGLNETLFLRQRLTGYTSGVQVNMTLSMFVLSGKSPSGSILLKSAWMGPRSAG